MGQETKHTSSGVKLLLTVVILLWVVTSGVAGYFISQTLSQNKAVDKLQADLNKISEKNDSFIVSMGPTLERLDILQDEQIKWEGLRLKYEGLEAERLQEKQELNDLRIANDQWKQFEKDVVKVEAQRELESKEASARNYQRRKAAQELIDKASRLESQKDLYAAMKVYSQALNVDPNSITATSGLNEITQEVQMRQEKDKYIQKIRLYDFVAKNYKSYLDEAGPGIEFKLKNNGDRSLSSITVTVYFQDGEGKTIYEEDWIPISRYRGDPLKPGYIWQPERGKFYPAKKVPSEWKPGPNAAYPKITDIEFVEE